MDGEEKREKTVEGEKKMDAKKARVIIKRKPHFLLNVVVFESTRAEKPLICSLEKKSIAVEHVVSWRRYANYLKDKIIKELNISEMYSIEEEVKDYVGGVYISTSRSTKNFCISSNLTSSGGILLANMIDDLISCRGLRLKFYNPHLGGQGWIAVSS